MVTTEASQHPDRWRYDSDTHPNQRLPRNVILINDSRAADTASAAPPGPAGADRSGSCFVDRWSLRLDGSAVHGVMALVQPVLRPDGAPAVLKLQPVDEETRGQPLALRTWGDRYAVGPLVHDPDSGTMLLERLDASRSLESVTDGTRALRQRARPSPLARPYDHGVMACAQTGGACGQGRGAGVLSHQGVRRNAHAHRGADVRRSRP
ncbi:aminoglycoside phosphotransferase family protein [Streptomyces sp. RTd22]|uniref:aminoglycoside phosphotransferase family protein n=1 Tax=Streptomyces sp. RTd22 TaxID=1841249 RepID=UPI000A51F99A|nr:aminoglycoside phosphotransferase family protein [Streptomyces sp. RTd22]